MHSACMHLCASETTVNQFGFITLFRVISASLPADIYGWDVSRCCVIYRMKDVHFLAHMGAGTEGVCI